MGSNYSLIKKIVCAFILFYVDAVCGQTPPSRFIILIDIFYDSQTDLTWQRCSVGSPYTQNGQLLYCDYNKAGNSMFSFDSAQRREKNGWRLPTLAELQSLPDLGSEEGKLLFLTTYPGDVWSSTTSQRTDLWTTKYGHYYMSMRSGNRRTGTADDDDDDYRHRVVLVRDGKPEMPADSSDPNQLTIHSGQVGSQYQLRDGETLSTLNNIIYQRCSVGQKWNQIVGCYGQVGTFSIDEARKLEINGWRLPTLTELALLIEKNRVDQSLSPTIDTTTFPDMDLNSLTYWSAKYTASSGWGINFKHDENSQVFTGSRKLKMAVRLVKNN